MVRTLLLRIVKARSSTRIRLMGACFQLPILGCCPSHTSDALPCTPQRQHAEGGSTAEQTDGVSAESRSQALEAWRSGSPVSSVRQEWDATVVLDLDGDGRDDWVLVAARQGSTVVAVVGVGDTEWRLGMTGLAGWSVPHLSSVNAIHDVTGDGLPEVDVVLKHTVFGTRLDIEHRIITAHGGIASVASPPWLPENALTVNASDISGSVSIKDGEVVSEDVLYNVAGYFQKCISHWASSSAQVILTRRECERPRERRNVLYEALHAHSLGDLPTAAGLYRQVVESDALFDKQGADGEPISAVRGSLVAVAMFRLVVLSLQQDDERGASGWLRRLNSAAGKLGKGLGSCAAVLVHEWSEQRKVTQPDPIYACQQAVATLGPDFSVGPIEEPGIRSRPFRVESLCPTKGGD